MSTTAPGRTLRITRETMLPADGRFQSSVSMSHWTQPRSSLESTGYIAEVVLPPGGRKNLGALPDARVMSCCACVISLETPAADRWPRLSGCVSLWLPISIPASATCLDNDGICLACRPISKNVATTPFCCRILSIALVEPGHGPSSNVSAMVLAPGCSSSRRMSRATGLSATCLRTTCPEMTPVVTSRTPGEPLSMTLSSGPVPT